MLSQIRQVPSKPSPELTGKARMAADVPRQIANAHTVFNVANTLLFLGFTSYFARLVERLIRERPKEERLIVRPRYLDEELVTVPTMAPELLRLELDLLDKLRRIYTLAKRVAKDFVPQEVASKA